MAVPSPDGRGDTKAVSLVSSPPALVQIVGYSSALGAGGELIAQV